MASGSDANMAEFCHHQGNNKKSAGWTPAHPQRAYAPAGGATTIANVTRLLEMAMDNHYATQPPGTAGVSQDCRRQNGGVKFTTAIRTPRYRQVSVLLARWDGKVNPDATFSIMLHEICTVFSETMGYTCNILLLPSRADCWVAERELLSSIDSATKHLGEDDLFIFYYAGNAYCDERSPCYLSPLSGSPQEQQQHYDSGELNGDKRASRVNFNKIRKALLTTPHDILFLMDCSFCGTDATTVPGKELIAAAGVERKPERAVAADGDGRYPQRSFAAVLVRLLRRAARRKRILTTAQLYGAVACRALTSDLFGPKLCNMPAHIALHEHGPKRGLIFLPKMPTRTWKPMGAGAGVDVGVGVGVGVGVVSAYMAVGDEGRRTRTTTTTMTTPGAYHPPPPAAPLPWEDPWLSYQGDAHASRFVTKAAIRNPGVGQNNISPWDFSSTGDVFDRWKPAAAAMASTAPAQHIMSFAAEHSQGLGEAAAGQDSYYEIDDGTDWTFQPPRELTPYRASVILTAEVFPPRAPSAHPGGPDPIERTRRALSEWRPPQNVVVKDVVPSGKSPRKGPNRFTIFLQVPLEVWYALRRNQAFGFVSFVGPLRREAPAATLRRRRRVMAAAQKQKPRLGNREGNENSGYGEEDWVKDEACDTASSVESEISALMYARPE